MARAGAFYSEVGDRIRALPGVDAVSWSNAVPVESRGYVEDVFVDGFEPGPDAAIVESIHMNMVSSGFFDVVGIPLVRGRDLDASPGSHEIVVNAALAARYWPGADPIGRRLQLGVDGVFEVVGVAADTTMRRLAETPFPYIYAPIFFDGRVGSRRLAVRAAADPAVVAASVLAVSFGKLLLS